MKTVTYEELVEAARNAGMAKFMLGGERREDMYIVGKDFLKRLYDNIKEKQDDAA